MHSILKTLLLITCLWVCFLKTNAQDLRDNFYVKVLSEELNRNIKRLSLPDMGKPFLISYKLRNTQNTSLRAERGKITTPFFATVENKVASVKVRVGDYHRNFDYMLFDGSYIPMPDENDVDEYRRLLWLETDRVYKNVAQQYNAVNTSLKRVDVEEKELNISDLSKVKSIEKDFGGLPVLSTSQFLKWKPVLEKLSALFTVNPLITTSYCTMSINASEDYLVTSEGTLIRKPGLQVSLVMSATLSGEEDINLTESFNVNTATLDDLPNYDALQIEAKKIISKLNVASKAPKFEGSYLGPVLFEDIAASSLISSFFRYSLTINRKSILYPDNSTTFYEDKLGQKLVASTLSLIARPHLKSFNAIQTTGSFEIDNDGVVPPDSLVLIKDGVLKNLLNGRIPTKKFPVSQGFSQAERVYSAGVLQLISDTTVHDASMKTQLIKAAKEEGLPYAYIVRGVSIGYGKAPYLYRIDTASGRETLMTDFKFTNLNMRSLRRFIIAGDKTQLLNLPLYTVICPQSMIIGEVELEAENNVVQAKPIIVTNPLLEKRNAAPVAKKIQKQKSASR